MEDILYLFLQNIVFLAAAAAGMWIVFKNVRQKMDNEKTDTDETRRQR